MNTALAQHEETGRLLEWSMEKPLPEGYAWIMGGDLSRVVKVRPISAEELQAALITAIQHPELLE